LQRSTHLHAATPDHRTLAVPVRAGCCCIPETRVRAGDRDPVGFHKKIMGKHYTVPTF
jgi:hypothetical protein